MSAPQGRRLRARGSNGGAAVYGGVYFCGFASEDNVRRLELSDRPSGGQRARRLADDLLVIPAPGHTRGHQVLLYRDMILFTGDHLAWSPESGTLIAFRDACWHSWPRQTRSMETLLAHRFEWVLPGHGHSHRSSADHGQGHAGQ
jgi:glyoxylase-like metal-dependent hydrolase (beta-lactamase superfamily II)